MQTQTSNHYSSVSFKTVMTDKMPIKIILPFKTPYQTNHFTLLLNL